MPDGEVHDSSERSRWALFLLGAGALAGIALALAGILRPASDLLPRGAIARVNDRVIRSESYERAWRRVASDKRNPMGEPDRAHVLKRMIEEELLIQRGEAIGLVESDPGVRRSISVAMIQAIVAESEASQPDEAALRAFYQENQRYFAPPGTLHVRQLYFQPRPGEAASEALARASVAYPAIAGGLAFVDALERYGDPPLVAIPDVPLPARKLQQYIGPLGVDRVSALRPQEVSTPIEFAGGVRIFQLLSQTPAVSPAFEAVRDRVESAFRRDAADRALRDSLARLWQEAAVALSPDAPEGVF